MMHLPALVKIPGCFVGLLGKGVALAGEARLTSGNFSGVLAMRLIQLQTP